MSEKIKNICGSLTKNFFFCFVIFYLTFHLLNGENGVITYIKQKNQLEEINKKLTLIESKRNKIQNKVERLYPSSLDADLLDEQYRKATGSIRENEVIYYY